MSDSRGVWEVLMAASVQVGAMGGAAPLPLSSFYQFAPRLPRIIGSAVAPLVMLKGVAVPVPVA
jgi:hypothetical protein